MRMKYAHHSASDPQLPGLQARVQLSVERHIRPTCGIIDVERIAYTCGVVALERELLLAQLEGAGELERAHDAHEERPRIVGQAGGEGAPQLCEFEALRRDQRRHAGTALGPGHAHPVYGGVRHSGTCGDHLRDLGGGHVLTLPAEGVADAIDEVEEALLVLAHEIAGAIPGVSGREHIAQDLAGGGRLIGVALEVRGTIFGEDLAERFAWLLWGAAHAAPRGVARGRLRFEIELHQRHRQAMREEGWNASDRARAALAVVEREVAFSRGVILEDLRNAEAPLELAPHIAAQPVAAGEAQRVLRLLRLRRARQQIAAQFADVLEHGAAFSDHILPEAAR